MDTASGQPFDDEALIEHLEWVRALAERLVGDAELAEDLRQEVSLAILTSTPLKVEAVRAWLGTVVRHLAWQRGRREARRREIEESAAREEALPATSEIVEQVQYRHWIIDCVLGLREPYRTTILMRYSDQRTPQEIADELGLPLATVKTRLRRGLVMLREKVPESERRLDLPALAAWLLPRWLRQRAGLPMALASVALVVAVLAISLRSPVRRNTLGPGAPGPALQSARLAEPEPLAHGRLPGEPETPITTPPPGPSPVVVPGVVLDLASEPVAGVTLRFVPEEGTQGTSEPTSSDAAGTFEVLDLGRHGRIHVEDPRWEQVAFPHLFPSDDPSELVVLVAPARAIEGRIVDEQGTPVAGAELRFRFVEDFRLGIDRILDRSSLGSWTRRSGTDGSFRFDSAPRHPGTILWVGKAGYGIEEVALLDELPVSWTITLTPADSAGVLVGTVVDEDGAPCSNTWVSAEGRMGRTDRLGRFQVHASAAVELVAARKGNLPGRGSWDPGDPPPRLVLGGPTFAIEGQVVDGAGRPMVGVRVRPLGGTPFGVLPRSTPGTTTWEPATLERALGADQDRLGTTTDGEGRFVLTGLLDRSYRLALVDVPTLARSVTDPIDAGTRSAHLVLREEGAVVPVEGQVVDPEGRPIPGVRVAPRRQALSVPDSPEEQRLDYAGFQITDAEGRFAWDALATEGLELDLSKPPSWFGLPFSVVDHSPGDSLELTLERIVHLRVIQEAHPGADGFEVLDARGNRMILCTGSGPLVEYCLRGTFPDGRRSRIHGVGQSAGWVVLLRGEDELERQQVDLTPGVLENLRY